MHEKQIRLWLCKPSDCQDKKAPSKESWTTYSQKTCNREPQETQPNAFSKSTEHICTCWANSHEPSSTLRRVPSWNRHPPIFLCVKRRTQFPRSKAVLLPTTKCCRGTSAKTAPQHPEISHPPTVGSHWTNSLIPLGKVLLLSYEMGHSLLELTRVKFSLTYFICN